MDMSDVDYLLYYSIHIFCLTQLVTDYKSTFHWSCLRSQYLYITRIMGQFWPLKKPLGIF